MSCGSALPCFFAGYFPSLRKTRYSLNVVQRRAPPRAVLDGFCHHRCSRDIEFPNSACGRQGYANKSSRSHRGLAFNCPVSDRVYLWHLNRCLVLPGVINFVKSTIVASGFNARFGEVCQKNGSGPKCWKSGKRFGELALRDDRCLSLDSSGQIPIGCSVKEVSAAS